MVRLTKKVRQQLLDQNDGFTERTSFDSRNHSWTRDYKIDSGKLKIRERGKTSWSDSRYDKTWEADDKEVHSFLYKVLYALRYDDEEE